MRAVSMLVVALLSVVAIGCDADRISNLEKQNQDLKAQVDRVRHHDLQATCSSEAKAWFQSNWRSDDTTEFLNYSNHYNELKNACFVVVEMRSKEVNPFGRSHKVSLWNVLENSKLGEIDETINGSELGYRRDVYVCSVDGHTPCTTEVEFQVRIKSFMSD